VGVEALVRWNHPRRGLLMPAKFVEVAEELKLVDRIDGIVCNRAVADLRLWDNRGLVVPKVSVNVSARRLNTPDLIAQVTALAPPPGRLVFEILESVYLDRRSQHMTWNLDALAELGIEIEIDDFGTGHNSISSVLAIQPARLKVAREIIQAFADHRAQSSLVEAVVALGRSLGVGLVAEGVETQAQLRAVREMGFDMIQGFALAEPMPAGDLAGFLERRAARVGSAT
jgi:EAL domain-containing protein (putative c-di-GMP-specific phosphodiesterase class I)